MGHFSAIATHIRWIVEDAQEIADGVREQEEEDELIRMAIAQAAD